MPMHVTCPACAGALQVPRKLRGRTLFCPKCGQPLVITPEGVAQRGAGPAAAAPPGRNSAVLILVALALVVGAGIAVGVVLLNQPGPRHKEPPPVARHAPDPTRGEAEPAGTKAGKPETPQPDRGTDPKPEPKKASAGPEFVTMPPIKRGPEKAPVGVKLIRTMESFDSTAYAPAFSPDDRILATGSGFITFQPTDPDSNGAVRLWDVATGTAKATLKVQGSRPISLAFGPGGKTLVMGNDGANRDYTRSEAQIWDVAGGRALTIVNVIRMGGSPTLSRDGKFLATVSWPAMGRKDATKIAVWDLGNGNLTARPWSLAFSPDGKLLASSGDDNTIILWDLASGKSRWSVPTGNCGGLAFSPDGKTLVGGLTEKGDALNLFDVATGKHFASLPVFVGMPEANRQVNSLAYSPDGKLLAVATSAGGQGNVYGAKLWDVASGKAVATLSDKKLYGVVFSHDGKLLAGSLSGVVMLWQVTGGDAHRGDDHRLEVGDPVPAPKGKPVLLTGHTGPVYSVLFTRDGKTLISGGYQDNQKSANDQRGEIKLWDVSSGRNTRTFEGPFPFVYSLALSPDGETLAASVHGGAVPLFDVATGKKTFTLGPVPESVINKAWIDYNWGVTFSPDGKTVAAANWGRYLILWDVPTRKYTRNLDLATQNTWNRMGPGGGYCLAFSPDGKTLAGGDSFGINLWDVASGKLTANLTGHIIDPKTNTATVYSVAFSPDGKILASGSEDHTIKLWDLASGKCTATLKGHSADVQIRSVAFSRDGKMLASGGGVQDGKTGKNGEIRVWDVASGKVIHRFAQETGSVSSVAFSPNGRLLASGSGDGTVKLWDVAGNGALAR